MKFSDQAAVCAALVWVACYRNLIDEEGRWRASGWLLVVGGALGWYVTPFLIATLCHPSDVIRLQAALLGLPQPHLFTVQQLVLGFAEAVFALAVLIVGQLCGGVLVYGRAFEKGGCTDG
jgi:hypothetical protein